MRDRGLKRRTVTAVAGLVALLAAGGAAAAVCRGVEFPPSIQAGGVTLDLNGLGVRKATFLRINVYVAALYLPPGGARPATDPRAIMGPAARGSSCCASCEVSE